MKTNVSFTVPVATGDTVTITLLSSYAFSASTGSQALTVEASQSENTPILSLALTETNATDKLSVLLATLADYLFSRSDVLEELTLNQALVNHLNSHCQGDELISSLNNDKTGTILRAAFYQNGLLWHWRGSRNPVAETWAFNDQNIRHPERLPQPEGLLYQRYDFSNDLLVTLETLDPDRHLDLFHDWMNQPRVAEFWELDKSKQELKDYIVKQRADRYSWPVLACLNGEPLGYLEIYWVMEDRLGPYYPCQPWDRGSHVLVGNTNFLGPRYSKTWTCALSHFLFLDDPRTRTLAGEPRADNQRLLKLLEPARWFFVKEFDFPHKRSALIQCHRETFFQQVRL
ncbi:GNAT family N-acetyltransferase [Parendozoicomonas haliclonae]|uniref:N(6)-hydroxylysine O-acetyltransferase n=1 Tax=Parendozoicomonas haliclonae TaxID=1960125 RepID=A0A1X7ALR3_9GAMM|nr:GNAT family N-acetyltransferase [Parendozoicomonas haliclonae]SMA48959.1 N(6)-hydroxylysine O-acetyltransferase [Parendozoicomonas haliclonae]